MISMILASVYLPESLQTFGSELANAWPVFVALGIIFGGLYRMIRRAFKKIMHETVVAEIRPIREQFKNNGGSTMKDAVDNLTARVEKINDRVGDVVAAQNILSDAQEIANEALIKHTDSDAENFQKILDLAGAGDLDLTAKATIVADAVAAEAAVAASAVKAEAIKVAEAAKAADVIVSEAIKKAEELRIRALNVATIEES